MEEQLMIRFASDAGLYAQTMKDSNPRSFIMLYRLQEAMKERYPEKICQEFLNQVGGEIKKI
jgi:hypothetical protein